MVKLTKHFATCKILISCGTIIAIYFAYAATMEYFIDDVFTKVSEDEFSGSFDDH